MYYFVKLLFLLYIYMGGDVDIGINMHRYNGWVMI